MKDIQQYFNKYNKQYFGGKLPKVKIYLAPKKFKAIASIDEYRDDKNKAYFKIQISRSAMDCGFRIASIALLHEMTHLSVGLEHQHDKVYQRAKRKLILAGAYDDLL